MDADDLIQDAIIAVLEKFESIKDKSAFKSFLFSTASNLNKMRSRRKKFHADFNAEELQQLTAVELTAEQQVDFKIVYEKLLELPQKTAEAMMLFYISDLSLDEIRKIQGGSLSGVKLRIKRGREKLVEQFQNKREVKMVMLFFTF